MFPVLAIVVLIYGLIFEPGDVEAHMAALRPFVPTTVVTLLDSRLQDLTSKPVAHLTIGLVVSTATALYMSSYGINYLILLLNAAYRETSARGFLRRFAVSIALTLGGLIVLVTSLAAVAVVPLLAAHLPFPDLVKHLALWGRWPLLAGVIFASLLGLYRFAPSRMRGASRRAWPGAALSTLLWLLLSALFSLYVQNFGKYDAIFGTLSAAVVLMLWIYYSAFAIAVGAIFNFELALRRTRA